MNKPVPPKKKPRKSAAPKKGHDNFLIVGIGASAGGIQALKTFFENVPANSGAAYVVILHLSPDHDSQLAEVLQVAAKIPVTRVMDKARVEPDHVYVISPNESLSMNDGHLAVSPIHTVEERRAPVDIFFRTLAESHRERAVAVILSGTGANGSMGIKRVKENGGAAFVQDPREAEFSEMPRNSIATELIDEILNVGEIPRKIAVYGKNLGKIVVPTERGSRVEEDQRALNEIFTQLRVRLGHDFSNYKRPTILRRIERRVSIRNLSGLPAYAVYLKENVDEIHALLKDLLISVTNFFRDPENFAYLETEVLPKIIEGKKAKDQIRLWVAACATGEEAYSIAMLLAEQLAGLPDAPSVQIFATDIDEDAIAAARSGFYTLNDAADVSPERLSRFFIREKEGYRIRRELREMILFARHNLLKDPPFSHLDLASCRNLLIYFNRTAQERVMQTFHFAIKPGSYLFVGSSESVDSDSELYTPVSREHHIFRSRQTAPRISYPVPDLSPVLRYDQLFPATPVPLEAEQESFERISYGELHQQILEQYAPPSLIVNEHYDIVHVSERAGRYLQIAGEPSKNLFRLIRPELRLELSTAVYQAVQRQSNVRAENLKMMTDDDGVQPVNVSIRPVLRQTGGAAHGFILIFFEPASEAPEAGEAVFVPPEPPARQLEEELMRSQSKYRFSVEQAEIQAEELKASNEELQAINEELRSATEELETGKEELQSVNEELVTVNQELKIKIEELSQSNNDFQNLINSTNIGTIFLDRQLRVKMFTPVVTEIFNLIPADAGRLISDITNRLDYLELISDVETVLNKLTPIEREVATSDGAVFLMHITPYRTSEDHISGTIMTFVNITSLKTQETELLNLNSQIAQQARLFNATLSGITDFAYIFDRAGRFIYSNPPLPELLGIRPEEIIGKNFFDLGYPAELAAKLQGQIEHIYETGETIKDETPFTGAGGTEGFYEYIFSPVTAADGSVELVAGSTRDITVRKQRESKSIFLSEINRELTHLAPIEKIMQTVGRKIGDYLNLSACGFVEISEQADEAMINYGWHREDVPEILGAYRLEEFLTDDFQVTVRAGDPFAVRDTQADPRTDAGRYAALKIGSFLGIPLTRHGQWRFLLVVYHSAAHDWEPNEIELVSELATHIWVRLESARADEALRDSEENLRIAVEAAELGTWSWDLSTGEVRRNERLSEIFGIEPHKNPITAAEFFSYVYPEDRPRINLKLQKIIEEKSSFADEYRIVGNGGEIRWVEGYGRAFEGDSYGQPVKMSGVIIDISSRKVADVRIRESEEHLRIAVEAAEMGTWSWDLTSDEIIWNERHFLLFGMKPQKGPVRPEDFFAHVHEDDRERVGKSLQKAVETKTLFEAEFRARLETGEIRWMEGYGQGVEIAGGKMTKMSGVMSDITGRIKSQEDLRDSEERLRLVINSVEEYFIITSDRNGIITGWNPGAEKVFGYTEPEAVGLPADIIFTPEDVKKRVPQKEMLTALEKGRAEDERWHLRRDGSRFYASGVMQAIHDSKVDRFVKIARDMTERNNADKIRRDKEMLQKLVGAQEDERKRIARDLHDELGQQLTALRLKLESVKKLCDEEELCDRIDEVQKIAGNLDAGIDFLAWELRPAALDDLGLRAALAKYVKEWSHFSGIAAELLNAEGSHGRLIPEAETNLYRITQEALNNVYKHAKAKRVEIALEKRGPDMVVLIIGDDGKGFNPKSKMNRSKGIGLIGMRERATLIGGNLEIESARGKGTTIFVRVPLSNLKEENIND